MLPSLVGLWLPAACDPSHVAALRCVRAARVSRDATLRPCLCQVCSDGAQCVGCSGCQPSAAALATRVAAHSAQRRVRAAGLAPAPADAGCSRRQPPPMLLEALAVELAALASCIVDMSCREGFLSRRFSVLASGG
mmetsp:Transcript_83850/g.160143  ORF Transcript_83850/g.160143 Transcript_83850/m.160143 type:complete len:136 (-) Transcript_83850:133-540(-)